MGCGMPALFWCRKGEHDDTALYVLAGLAKRSVGSADCPFVSVVAENNRRNANNNDDCATDRGYPLFLCPVGFYCICAAGTRRCF